MSQYLWRRFSPFLFLFNPHSIYNLHSTATPSVAGGGQQQPHKQKKKIPGVAYVAFLAWEQLRYLIKKRMSLIGFKSNDCLASLEPNNFAHSDSFCFFYKRFLAKQQTPSGMCAIEMAILGKAKTFIKSSACQRSLL